jgi:hypothetical protein
MKPYLLKENLKNYYDKEAELRNDKPVKPEWKISVREKFNELIKLENKKHYWNWVQEQVMTVYFLLITD